MLHKYSNNDIDKDKLGHENEYHEVYWCYDLTHATVSKTVVAAVTICS